MCENYKSKLKADLCRYSGETDNFDELEELSESDLEELSEVDLEDEE